MGGNVRLGPKDSLLIARGKLAQSNTEQIPEIRRMIEDLRCDVATPDEARKIRSLTGSDKTAF